MAGAFTSEHLKSYTDNGFCVVEGLVDDSLIRRARDVVDRLLASDTKDVGEREPADPSMVRRIWAPTSRDEVFTQIVESGPLLDGVCELVGANVVYQYSKLNVKAPQVGSMVAWHQDFAYYPHTNTDLVAVLIYLDDATRENACLKVASGSHRLGLLDHDVDGAFGGKISSLEQVGVDPASVVDCEAPAGAAIFLHPLVVHASEKNTSDRYRRAFIPAYRSADALPIYYGPHAAHNEPNARLLRGRSATTVRCESAHWRLPIAAAEFNSLYQIQEGSHLTASGRKSTTGYFSHEVPATDGSAQAAQ
ncbi:phytanoyl-CoA dioxygenase family protein [Catellatospora tritici]|uniref:phytanoyl-CoA dioxygenase family protein n=1 Tax=Catellatospora tritici TaxID=2851566 RepID=UPI0020C3E342|nr:phytanoyl-CoA dioxygenase family protein [Catellatospora tritici]MBV1849574.1 phytanoyl-CoA dioxygenase family protein [Catellatospora tritici]